MSGADASSSQTEEPPPQPDGSSLNVGRDDEISKAIDYLRNDDDDKAILAMILTFCHGNEPNIKAKVEGLATLVKDKSDETKPKLFVFFEGEDGLYFAKMINSYYNNIEEMRNN